MGFVTSLDGVLVTFVAVLYDVDIPLVIAVVVCFWLVGWLVVFCFPLSVPSVCFVSDLVLYISLISLIVLLSFQVASGMQWRW